MKDNEKAILLLRWNSAQCIMNTFSNTEIYTNAPGAEFLWATGLFQPICSDNCWMFVS